MVGTNVTVARLNHPHIVTLYSVEEHADVRFLTMELVEGQGLDDGHPISLTAEWAEARNWSETHSKR